MIDAAGLDGRTARLAFLRVAACVMAIIVCGGGGRGQTRAQCGLWHVLITPIAVSILPCWHFVDESGDAGRGIGQGSSPLLVLAVVTFEDRSEAAKCDRAIDDLARDLGRGSQEFRFSKDSHRTRLRFLDAVSPFRFAFHAFVFDKRGQWPCDEDVGGSLYVWACEAALKHASAAWSDAIVVLDSMGDRRFQRELRAAWSVELKALRGPGAIRRVTSRRSHSERLLQLADYVAGVVSRQRLQRKWGDQYFATIRRRGTQTLWR